MILSAAMLLAGAVGIVACGSAEKKIDDSSDRLNMVVGTFSDNIYLAEFNQATGEIVLVDSVATVGNGSFQVLNPSDSTFYSIFGNPNDRAAIRKFKMVEDSAGHRRITPLGDYACVGDDGPCYVNVSPDGKWAVSANYPNGSISLFPTSADGVAGSPLVYRFAGSGPDAERQANAHLHCVVFTPDRRNLVACDLGSDKLYLFPLESLNADSIKAPQEVAMMPGCGPRHIVFNAQGDVAYLITEIGDQVVALHYDGSTLEPFQIVAASTAGGQGGADIHLSPDGRHLYASVRIKGDGVALFDVDQKTGELTYKETTPTGGHPRNFMVSPNGRYVVVACRDNNSVEVYERDSATGSLKPTDNRAQVTMPVCVNVF